MSISEKRLACMEMDLKQDLEHDTGSCKIGLELINEIHRLQKQVKSQRVKLKAFDEMPKGADTPVRW